jgi:UDP-N-acetylglucosamine 2-epimerase
LRRAGVTDGQIFFVGNTMIDTLLKNVPRLRPPACWQPLKLEAGRFFVVTLHRPANVDGERKLLDLLRAISDGTKGLPVVFPVHPRTAKNLRELDSRTPQLHYVDPLGYLEFNYLVKHAKGVITDSGGITEETTVLGVPCLTLRDNTERPETITIGTNELIGTDPSKLPPALARLMAGSGRKEPFHRCGMGKRRNGSWNSWKDCCSQRDFILRRRATDILRDTGHCAKVRINI